MTSPDDPLRYDPSSLAPGEWRRSTRALQRIAKSIVGDADQSEDIVQGAWVRALERGGRLPGDGWLRRIVRHRSIDARRQRAARPVHGELLETIADDEAPASAVASRIESQRILLDAVDALAAPYRVTIYLRYFEGLSVREVADRMDVPPKTVETRQARAIAMLRETLGPIFRDPETGRWSPALVAFYDPFPLLSTAHTGSVAAPFVPKALIRPYALLVGVTMKKFAAAAMALILLVTGWMAIDQLRASPGVGADTAATGSGIGGESEAAEVIPVSVAGGPARSPLARSPEPPIAAAPAAGPLSASGALRMTVFWSDGEAAEGVGLVAGTSLRGPKGVRQHIREVTGADGVAFFSGMPPGKYLVRSDRGSSQEEDDTPVEVLIGEITEATLRIAPGLDVAGRVVDAKGVPVAGAGVWLTSMSGRWTAGAIVTYAGPGGRFQLRDLPVGPQQLPSLGALAPGYLPSSLVDLDRVDKSETPVPVELVVRRGGGALEGVVTGEDGQPMEGVVVVLGDIDGVQEWRFDDTIKEAWSPRYATSDADGRYRIDALAGGERPLRARRLGLAQWSAQVTITAGKTTRQDIVLAPGAEVSGTVTDESGVPIAGARIHAFDLQISEKFLQSGQIDYDGAFAQEVVLTSKDGTYRLRHLPRKLMFLYAMEARPAGRARGTPLLYTKTKLDLSHGDELTWDPVLSDGGVISGSVRYADGQPIKRIFVNLSSGDPSAPDGRSMYTETGDFKFIQLGGESYSVSAQIWDLPSGKKAPSVDGAIPNGGPVELVAGFDSPAANTEGTVRVRFLDEGGRTGGASGVSVMLGRNDKYSWRSGELQDGVWMFDLDEPGDYRAIAFLGERIVAAGEPFEFTAGAHIDLGTLASGPGGTLVLRLERSEEHPPEEIVLNVSHDDYRHSEDLELGNRSVLRLEGMEPGKGTITLLGKNLTRLEIPFEVLAGEETVMNALLVPAVGVLYHIELPVFSSATAIAIRFVNLADSSIVHENSYHDARRYGNPIDWTIQLGIGDYRLEVELGDGRRAHTTFSVLSLKPTDAPRPRLTVK